MLVCDKHRTGKTRVARYELILRDRFSDQAGEPFKSAGEWTDDGQEYGKHDIFPIRKDLCVECGEKLLAIINAFIEALKTEDFFDQLKGDFLEQTQQILAKKAEAIAKQKEVQVGR